MAMVSQKTSQKGKRWIANKYYHTVRGRSWTFAVPLENRKVDKYHTLVRLSDTKIKRHIKSAVRPTHMMPIGKISSINTRPEECLHT